MSVVLFIERFQHTNHFPVDDQRHSCKGLRCMLGHAINCFEVTLVGFGILNDQRLTFTKDPARGAAVQRHAHWSKQVALEPLHGKKT